MQHDVGMVPLVSTRYLEMMSETAVAWMLLEGARIACEKLASLPLDESSAKEHSFYEGKKHAALFYCRNILPNVKKSAEILSDEHVPSRLRRCSRGGGQSGSQMTIIICCRADSMARVLSNSRTRFVALMMLVS